MSLSGSEERSQEQVEAPEAQPWRLQDLQSIQPAESVQRVEQIQHAKSVQESGQTTDDEHDVLGNKALARMNAAKSTAAGGAAAVSKPTKWEYMSLAGELYEAARDVGKCTAEHDKTRAKLDEAKERLAGVKRTFDEAMNAVASSAD